MADDGAPVDNADGETESFRVTAKLVALCDINFVVLLASLSPFAPAIGTLNFKSFGRKCS